MRVRLKNDWFAPNGILYRAVDNPHTLPDSWREALPPSVVFLPARPVDNYAEMQDRITREHDPLAVDNANKYQWPQPEGNLLAQVTPSDPAQDLTEEDRRKREENALKAAAKEAAEKRKKELEGMNEAQLRAIAKKDEIEVGEKDSKAQLVKKILNVEE